MCRCVRVWGYEVCFVYRPFSDEVNDWMPVDIYVGGIEHGREMLCHTRNL